MNKNPDNRMNSFFSKIDEILVKQKINSMMENFKKGNTEELAKKISEMDKTELINKIDEFDEKKLATMNINFAEIKKKITDEDLDKFGKLIGDSGNEIVSRIKAIMSSDSKNDHTSGQ